VKGGATEVSEGGENVEGNQRGWHLTHLQSVILPPVPYGVPKSGFWLLNNKGGGDAYAELALRKD